MYILNNFSAIGDLFSVLELDSCYDWQVMAPKMHHSLGNHLQELVLQDEPVQREPTDPRRRGLHKRLTLIETELLDVSNAFEAMKPGPELDRCLLKQHEEQISGHKSE